MYIFIYFSKCKTKRPLKIQIAILETCKNMSQKLIDILTYNVYNQISPSYSLSDNLLIFYVKYYRIDEVKAIVIVVSI